MKLWQTVFFFLLFTPSLLSLTGCGETHSHSTNNLSDNTHTQTDHQNRFENEKVSDNTYMLITENNEHFLIFDFYASHSMLITSNESDKKNGQWIISHDGVLHIVAENANTETLVKRNNDVFTITGPYANTYQGTELVKFKDNKDFADQAGDMSYTFGQYTYQFGSIEAGQRFTLNGMEAGRWEVKNGSVLMNIDGFHFYLSTFGSSEREYPNNNILIAIYDNQYNLLSMEAYRYQ